MASSKGILAVVAAAVGAAISANAYRPLTERGYPSVAAVLAGVIASELPLQTLTLQTVVVTAAARSASRRQRLIAGLLTACSAITLMRLHQGARHADIVCNAALDAVLGPEAESVTPSPVTAVDLVRHTAGLVGTARGHRTYVQHSDISYGPHGRANHLDIWRHPDAGREGRSPVILQIPGGAWVMGSKRGQAHPLLMHLADLGWIGVSINYRLSPRGTWPEHLVDVKRAIAWVKANIAEYGGEPDFIAVTGGSAGGHLTALAALTPNDAAYQDGFEDADTRVQAAVPFYGVYDLAGEHARNHGNLVPLLEQQVIKQSLPQAISSFRRASPLSHLNADAPPFFVLHGRNDTFLPVEQARVFVDRLRVVSTQPVVYAELPRAQHSFDVLGSVRARHSAAAVARFLNEIRARRWLSAVTPVPDVRIEPRSPTPRSGTVASQ